MIFQKKTCATYCILLFSDTKSHIKYVSRSGKNERKRERKGEKDRSTTFTLSVNNCIHAYICMYMHLHRERASPVICHLITSLSLYNHILSPIIISSAKLLLIHHRKFQSTLWRVHCVLVISKMFDPSKTKAASQKKVQQKKVIKQLIEQCINIVPINLRVGEYTVGDLIIIVDCIQSSLCGYRLAIEKWTTHL